MKIFLIIIGCIFLYILGVFITCVLSLYWDRCEYESSMVYDDFREHFCFSLGWPLTIWFMLGYLLYLKLGKCTIATTEFIYQITHNKEDK